MKVLFRISRLGFGGAEQVFLSVGKLFKEKYDIDVIFVLDDSSGENTLTASRLGFQVISLDVKRTLFSIKPFSNLINNLKPDVIISAYTDTNAACLLSGFISLRKIPIIVSEHASLNEHWQDKSKLKKILLRFYVCWIYKLANKVLCVSNGLKNQVDNLLHQPKKTETIYNPVRFKSVGFIDKKINGVIELIAVGRIAKQKDYSTLINAVFEIKKSRPVHLNIVGGCFDKSEYEKICSLIKLLELDNNVTLVGYTNNVEEYYKQADIFVMSSAWEGFGNVIVEAMAFGLPVVSTDCNYGPSEILENGRFGRLVKVADYIALANSICIEADTPLVTKDELIKRSELFSEENIAKQYLSLIEDAVLYEKQPD